MYFCSTQTIVYSNSQTSLIEGFFKNKLTWDLNWPRSLLERPYRLVVRSHDLLNFDLTIAHMKRIMVFSSVSSFSTLYFTVKIVQILISHVTTQCIFYGCVNQFVVSLTIFFYKPTTTDVKHHVLIDSNQFQIEAIIVFLSICIIIKIFL